MCDPELAEMHDHCGVFALYSTPGAEEDVPVLVSHTISLGLLALQHRGQESAGIATHDGSTKDFIHHKGMGLVSSAFDEHTLERLSGSMGIGHTRYATAGASSLMNAQPFLLRTLQGMIAVAHNGQLVNARELGRHVMSHGVGMVSTTDSEIIAQVLCAPAPAPSTEHIHGLDLTARLRAFMAMAKTSYSLAVMTQTAIYAVRDPFGNRPLSIGQMRDTKHPVWVVSSETCAFSAVGADFVREVLPGEIVRIDASGVVSQGIVPRPVKATQKVPPPPALCIFEYVYFSRADSVMEGQMVHSVRQRCGAQLAKESPVEADIVSTVPTSATAAALGYAKQAGIPYNEVLNKNYYIGRTFIQPDVRSRELGVKKKFSPLTENIVGKRIVIIDDSIVRGTTMAPIIAMLRNAGASEVHIRVASPPLKHICNMGINIPTEDELIANQMTEDEMARKFGADSLKYLSIEGLVQAVNDGIDKDKERGHCTACLTGKYPVELEW